MLYIVILLYYILYYTYIYYSYYHYTIISYTILLLLLPSIHLIIFCSLPINLIHSIRVGVYCWILISPGCLFSYSSSSFHPPQSLLLFRNSSDNLQWSGISSLKNETTNQHGDIRDIFFWIVLRFHNRTHDLHLRHFEHSNPPILLAICMVLPIIST